MRRRHEGDFRTRRCAQTCIDPDALRIDGHGAQAHPGEQQLPMGHEIARVLDPHLVAGRKQHADGDVDRVLGPGRHHDLLGLATHGARGPQIITDAAAQVDRAARIRVAEVLGPKRAHGAMGQLAPDVDRARVDQRAAGVERPRVGLRGRLRELGERLRRVRNLSRLPHGRAPRRTRNEPGEIRRYVSARSRTALDVAFGQQLLVRSDDRCARELQAGRHGAARRQLRARRQHAREHAGAHLHVELARQWRAVRPVELPAVELRPSLLCHLASRKVVCRGEPNWTNSANQSKASLFAVAGAGKRAASRDETS